MDNVTHDGCYYTRANVRVKFELELRTYVRMVCVCGWGGGLFVSAVWMDGWMGSSRKG